MYSPALGRWMTVDPSGFDGGDTNQYGFIKNDAINYHDPFGLFAPVAPVIVIMSPELAAAIAAAAAAAAGAAAAAAGAPICGEDERM